MCASSPKARLSHAKASKSIEQTYFGRGECVDYLNIIFSVEQFQPKIAFVLFALYRIHTIRLVI